ncbi:hypothetical protein D9619_010825 [Psilocybe cf. subviscida]|uniref:Uncharacterized protein n=1 Tax=Psilocybe cf. subviscida TaxID=2480587 RepID=A0A8H5F0C6_9AGAR|nr:hypothetical protein D9619_010825 [Psilocybe cf. subviscida]
MPVSKRFCWIIWRELSRLASLASTMSEWNLSCILYAPLDYPVQTLTAGLSLLVISGRALLLYFKCTSRFPRRFGLSIATMPSSQKSERPFCACTVHQCSEYPGGGRTLSRNVFNRHQMDEWSSLLFQHTGKVSADTLKAQIEDLSAHLAASTLSDEVSGPPNIPVCLTNQYPDIEVLSPQHNPLPRDQEREVLQHLQDVDESLDISTKEIMSDILSMEPPSLKMTSTVFPLEVHFEVLARLSNQLSMVSFNSAEVITRLQYAKGKLNQLLKCLTDAKDAWLTRLREIEDEKQLRGGVPFSTGSLVYLMKQTLIIELEL